jgi:hypothetical protein
MLFPRPTGRRRASPVELDLRMRGRSPLARPFDA